MENNDIIIVKQSDKNMFFKYLDNVYDYYNCSRKNLLFRIMKKLNIQLTMFYGKWKYFANNCKYIVFFDVDYRTEFSKYIKNHNPNIKVIFWYWNAINQKNKKFLDDKNIDEIWTYNRFDAEKYGLNYNPQFYYYKKIENEKNEFPESDVIFMGRDKGREESLQRIKKDLEENNLKCSFNIISNESDFMDYDEYLKNAEKSKCILDFSHIIPCGLSLRPLEALFLHKKLITNNNDIVNYKFYNKNNIYILGNENDRDVKQFIDSPYVEIPNEVIEYYNYYFWLKRFKK